MLKHLALIVLGGLGKTDIVAEVVHVKNGTKLSNWLANKVNSGTNTYFSPPEPCDKSLMENM